MREDKKVFDIKFDSHTKGKFNKLWLVAGALVVAAGVIVAGYFNDAKQADETVGEVNQASTAESSQSEETVRGSDIEVPEGSAVLSEQQNQSETTQPPISSQPSQTSPRPVVRPAICQQAEDELVGAKAKAQLDYDTAAAEAAAVYDLEIQEADTKLAALQQRRAAAINVYRDTIAAATDKYNSSQEPDSYTVYQQERGAALETYNTETNNITAEERTWLDQKTDAGKRKDLRINEAQPRLDAAAAAAQADYNQKTAGQNCG